MKINHYIFENLLKKLNYYELYKFNMMNIIADDGFQICIL